MTVTEVSSRTTVVAGPLTFVVRDDDPEPDGTQPFVVDGVTLTDQLDLPWPMQETSGASLSLWAPAAEDLAGVVKGQPLRIVYATPRTAAAPVWDIAGSVAPAAASFNGRITDAVLRVVDNGVVLDLTAMDLRSVDLATEVGDAPWPQETVEARLDRIFGLLGLPFFVDQEIHLPAGGVITVDPGALGYNANVAARDVDAQPALGLVTELLDAWAVDIGPDLTGLGWAVPTPGAGMVRWVVNHDFNPDGTVAYWTASPRLSGILEDPYGLAINAADFGPTPEAGGGYGVTFPADAPDRSPQLVPSGFVDLAASYTQRPGTRPNRSTVAWLNAGAAATVTVSDGTPPPVTRFRLDTKMTSAAAATRAAQLYLPDPGSADWFADTWTWRWYADTAAQAFPMPAIGDLLTIGPIDPARTPPNVAGRSPGYYSGILTGRVVQLVAARPVVDLTITPIMRPLMGQSGAWGGTALRWDDLPAGVTWDDLNTRDTWDDYRLVRA